MTTVKWLPKALKQLRKIHTEDQKRILKKFDELEEFPDCSNVKSLTNREDYRFRVGRCRILFSVESGEPVVIYIEEVKKRDERTY
ncbi:type II toxin-antitoxin system RelE/ParE family toxin [Desulfovibrio sp. JC010]|uniref:type II toxin-antitoxin system RelE family toxin n=1 Tax=Desulfovibrio sp. JC010 TaxID=2593641 RepID=UPI0013D32957|nr:type II toxin-antitoxin system RelE/ParE family toxin [Desulfovibrio sp. JC010]NDV28849.1 type II toxin-antitoxin system RelE/ParE family toxin [Desulfovibrio sp. JC010]